MTDPFLLPEHGWIDIHSHLLPGIDDGCQTLEESLECVDRLKQRGFVGSVCTPHFWPFHFPMNSPERITAGVLKLQQQLESRGITYALWSGAEVRIDQDTISWMQRWGVPVLGGSRCVLVDYWGITWERYVDDTLDFLLDSGYQPILAHPERMGFDDAEMEAAVASVQQRGVWLQGNFNSLTGNEGRTAERWVRRLLADDRYHLLAMDMHRPDSLTSRFQGMIHVEAEFGGDRLHALLHERPRSVLTHLAGQTAR